MARPKQGYFNDAGERIPGVTTVIGLLNKPALVGWAGKLCAEAGWNAGRNGEPLPRWSDVCYGTRDKAAADGTRAHDLFEQHLRGQTVVRGLDDSDGAWQAFENARRWLDLGSIEFEVWPHERPLVSERYGFAGTPDAVAREPDGAVRGCDWKTSKGVYPEFIIQLAAYRHLLRECEELETKGCHLVTFHRDYGDFHHHFYDDDALDIGWEVFKALLAVWTPYGALKGRFR